MQTDPECLLKPVLAFCQFLARAVVAPRVFHAQVVARCSRCSFKLSHLVTRAPVAEDVPHDPVVALLGDERERAVIGP